MLGQQMAETAWIKHVDAMQCHIHASGMPADQVAIDFDTNELLRTRELEAGLHELTATHAELQPLPAVDAENAHQTLREGRRSKHLAQNASLIRRISIAHAKNYIYNFWHAQAKLSYV
ncbi:hypothetical protein WT90_08755 [Burkholderia stagnalis]|nr:hypothetical protein WT90_08755 [Burkholderia stagnalis]